MATGYEVHWRVQRALEACVMSTIKDFSVLCSAITDPVILLFPYSCQCPAEFRRTLNTLLCVYMCTRGSLSAGLRAGRGLAEG